MLYIDDTYRHVQQQEAGWGHKEGVQGRKGRDLRPEPWGFAVIKRLEVEEEAAGLEGVTEEKQEDSVLSWRKGFKDKECLFV